MHPQTTRIQLLRDLLDLGLAEVAHTRSEFTTGSTVLQPDKKQPIYLLTGPFAEFHSLTRKHHLAMERELAKDDEELSSSTGEYALGDVE